MTTQKNDYRTTYINILQSQVHTKYLINSKKTFIEGSH